MTRRSRSLLSIAGAVGIALALTMILLPAALAAGSEPECAHGTKQSVTAGIVNATGCWTQATVAGATVYTAAFADNPDGIDLNGLVITGDKTNGLQINASTRAVTSIQVSDSSPASVQLNSRNWPIAGKVQPLGSPFRISFVASTSGTVQLADLHFGSNQVAGAMAGLSPVGDIETSVLLEPGGVGSMDVTYSLAGIFTFKNKPQSLTLALPTKPEEGTTFDGIELKLHEIDGIKFIKLYDLEAKVSLEKKLISGSANLGFPFFGEGTGVGVGFTIQNGVLTDLSVSVHGTKIPIGASGTITDIAGGFHVSGTVATNFDGWCKSIGYEGAVIVGSAKGPDAYGHWKCHKGSTNDPVDVTKACQWQTGNPASTANATDGNDAYSWICTGVDPSKSTSFDLGANAQLTANFGPEIPSPFGNIPPVRATARLDLGYTGGELVISIRGGLELFRIPVGDAYLIIHSNSGVQFGAGVGIGLPSYRNNENDPFYLGLRVDGWISRGKFQFEGKGKFALFNLKLLEGDGLINDRGIGACWTVIGIPGGAFYKWGSSGPETFGTTCRLADYREQFPAGATASAARARTFRLTQVKTVLAVKGIGAAPRFELRSAGGRVIRVPATGSAVKTSDYAVVVNRFNRTTYVILPRARGTWTITPYPGSATITSVKAADITPEQRVTAKVLGTGTTRTLVYRARKVPGTRLLFLEVLPDGTQFQILNTTAISGRRRFRLETGSGYGIRKLKAIVIQGAGITKSAVVARYRVNPPPILPASSYVDASRNGFTVDADWSGVRGASGYLVQVSTYNRGVLAASFIRRVSARTNSLELPGYPATPGRSVATVWALNSNSVPGKPASSSFLTTASALTLSSAARLSADSAYQHGGALFVRTQCPANQGHCQVRLQLRLNGRLIVDRAFQQTPGTYETARLLPSRTADRRALAVALRKGRGHVRVNVRIFRLGSGGLAEAGATA